MRLRERVVRAWARLRPELRRRRAVWRALAGLGPLVTALPVGSAAAAPAAAVVAPSPASRPQAVDVGVDADADADADETERDRPSAADQGARWMWPVAAPAVSAPYAAPPTRYAAGHRGIDVTAVSGTPVVAPETATVRFAGMVVDRPVVTLDHGGGVLSSVEPVSSVLPVGSAVARGAVIGVVASGGHCGTACIHVGVRVDGEYVSPMLFFGRVPPAILLPLGRG
ncbi:murein hydrolase activator EnvC family protein [Leifsonia sp. NPDC014704]|uniref:murein hydrolase activator EnvC family protein n=1 Tax=Leifsonia sp. NPDC014704 TaxID=3364123 RepID=UPI0036F4A970